MDKTFSPSYSISEISYVEAEAVEFSRFRSHRKRTASASSSRFRFHIPGYNAEQEKAFGSVCKATIKEETQTKVLTHHRQRDT